MKNCSGRRRSGANTASIAGDLMLAPMVALMRLPLMATETQHGTALRTETDRAVSRESGGGRRGRDGGADVGDGSRRCASGPEILSGRTPSMLNGVAAERSMQAALKPASRAGQGKLPPVIPGEVR